MRRYQDRAPGRRPFGPAPPPPPGPRAEGKAVFQSPTKASALSPRITTGGSRERGWVAAALVAQPRAAGSLGQAPGFGEADVTWDSSPRLL